MATLNMDLFDALKAAGVDDPTARRAAQSVVGQDANYVKFEDRLDRFEGRLERIEKDGSEVKATIKLHGWMIGAVLALQVGILLRLLG